MCEFKSNKIFSSLLIATALTIGISFSDINTNSNVAHANTYKIQPLQGKIVSIPAGTQIPLSTTMELSSEYLVAGQNVSFTLANDFYYNNSLVAPIGSSINGTVIQAKKAGRAGVNGQLMVKFTNILTPYGQMIPISAKIQTDDGTGLLRGGTKVDSAKDYAKDLAVGSAAGAMAGVVFGPISGGNAGRGAALGTAVGAGLGLAKSLWDKGDEVVVPVGTPINIILDQQATFAQQQSYQY